MSLAQEDVAQLKSVLRTHVAHFLEPKSNVDLHKSIDLVEKVAGYLTAVPEAVVDDQEFREWFVSRLLLAWPSLPPQSAVVPASLAVVLDALATIKPIVFVKVFQELVDLLHSLMEASDSLFESPLSEVSVDLPLCKDDSIKAVFGDSSLLESFQTQLTRFFCDRVKPIMAHMVDRATSEHLLLALLKQIEIGDSQLKMASLMGVNKLVDLHGIPYNRHTTLRLYDTLFAMATLLSDNEHSEVVKEAIWKLDTEAILSECIESVLTKTKQESKEEFKSLAKIVIDFWERVLQPGEDNVIQIERLSDGLREALNDALVLSIEHLDSTELSFLRRIVFHDARLSESIVAKLVTMEVSDTSDAEMWTLSPIWKSALDNMENLLRQDELLLPNLAIYLKVGCLIKSDNKHSVGSRFLPASLVTETSQRFLEELLKASTLELGNVFYSVTSLASDLLSVQPEKKTFPLAIALVTMPFMDGENGALLDLKVPKQVSKVLVEKSGLWKKSKMTFRSIRQCAKLLSGCPNEICPKWRLQIYQRLWIEIEDDQKVNRQSLLEFLPKFLCTISRVNAVALIKRVANQVFEAPDTSLLRGFAKVSGNVVCVLSGDASPGTSHSPSILCRRCDESNRSLQPHRLVSLGDIEPLLKLVGCHDDIDFKTTLTSSLLKPLSNHVGFDRSLATLWMTFYEQIPTFNSASENRHASAFINALCSQIDCIVKPAFARDEESHTSVNGWLHQKSACDTVISFIEEASKGLDKRPKASIDILVRILISLCRTNVKFLHQRVVLMLFRLLLQPHCFVHVVSLAKDILLSQGLRRYKSAMMQQLATEMSLSKDPTIVFKSFLALIEDLTNVESLMSKLLNHLVVHLFLFGMRNNKDDKVGNRRWRAISCVAALMKVPKWPTLLLEGFHVVLPLLVINTKNDREYRECVDWLERELNISFGQIVSTCRQKLTIEILEQFHCYEKQMIQLLQWVVVNDKGSVSRSDVTKDEIIAYVAPKLLGVLGHFDQRLSNSYASKESKLRVLLSLQQLIRFMGPSGISDVKHKIMSALRGARAKSQGDQDVLSAIIDAWDAFVKTISTSKDVLLGPILPEVLASLVDTLHGENCTRDGKRVVKIVKFAVIDNSSTVQSYFPFIHFLPETDELSAVNSFIRKKSSIDGSTEFKNVLQFVMNSLNNENLEVKIHTLRKLKQLLRFNQGKMQGLMFMRERCDPIVTSVTSGLFNHLKDFTSTEVTALASQCLGFIGAIDPGRLDTSINVCQSWQICFSPEEASFGSSLLCRLIKAYLSALGSSEADACAFSIQEVLKCYNITHVRSRSEAWTSISEPFREVAAPFFTSLYVTDFKIPDHKPTSKTVFEEASEYHEWLFKWYLKLCGQLSESDKSRSVFVACLACVKKDVKVAEFLIPYIIMSVLLSGDAAARSRIHVEIERIIDAEASSSTNTQSAGDTMMFNSASKSTQHVQLERLAMHTVFAIMDHMNKWLREKTQRLLQSQSSSFSSNSSRKSKDVSTVDEDFNLINKFVHSVCQRKLANASFHCQSYARSLLHLEQHLRSKAELSCDDLFLLQATHAALISDGNSDYVVGVSALRKAAPKLNERLLENLALNRYQDALACYTGLTSNGSNEDGNDDKLLGMVRCCLETDQPLVASALSSANQNQALKAKLRPLQLQAAWELEQWGAIDEMLSTNKDSEKSLKTGWETLFASLMLDLKQKQRSKFNEDMESAHKFVAGHLGAAAMEQGPYRRAYSPHVVRLQILNEMQIWADHMLFSPSKETSMMQQEVDELLAIWHTRSNFSQEHLEAVQKTRRALLKLSLETSSQLESRLKSQLSMSWLETSKAARRSLQYDKAYSSLLRVEQSAGHSKSLHVEVLLERAKLLWSRDLKQEAIVELRRGVTTHFGWAKTVEMTKANIKTQSSDEVKLCGKVKLLLTRYLDDSGNAKADSLPVCYSEARALNSKSEDACYFSAKFYDKIVGKMYEVEQLDTKGDMVSHVVSNYSRSLLYGCRNIDQSLPRMLSLWLDFGARVAVVSDHKVKTDMENSLKRMNEIISRFTSHCPAYFLLLVIPQLTSRILHPNPTVFGILSQMLIKAFISYPKQTFWHIVSLVKSSVKQRRNRAKEILQKVSASEPELKEFVDQGLLLADALIQLAECEVRPGVHQVSKVAPALKQLLSKLNHCSVPNTRNTQVLLPTEEADRATHNPFEGQVATIVGVENEIVVMRSMICPKKVIFRGSDGQKHPFLCKPKDDLRRDCRLMDVNNLLNKIFMRDQQARKRDLRIRTYHVVPLNETSGIIEWVPNLEAIRPILNKQYRNRFGSNPVTKSEMEEYQRAQNDRNDPEENRRSYNILLKKHPSIFGEWFIQNYPDPHTWYLARLAFTRTTAVMSMVGFLLGLGDRHLENIMVDVSSGDTVHVDLNCLFNKGDELKVPEVVPFRLTHNMVHAMGPTGFEGPFRVACEVSLGLMRAQMDVLMSALRPFYFDPLVDWLATPGSRAERRRNAAQTTDNSGESVNQKAVETLLAIQKRLDGHVGYSSKRNANNKNDKMNKPLSVAGQVNYLIEEATSHDNLSQMYLGWAAYL